MYKCAHKEHKFHETQSTAKSFATKQKIELLVVMHSMLLPLVALKSQPQELLGDRAQLIKRKRVQGDEQK